MKIAVIGGTGLVGSKLVAKLHDDGHEAVVAAFPQVNTLTGQGLAEALSGADVAVDVTNSPSFEDTAALHFYRRALQPDHPHFVMLNPIADTPAVRGAIEQAVSALREALHGGDVLEAESPRDSLAGAR